MPAVSVRKLLRDSSAVFGSMERDGEPVLITRRGRPVAALIPVDPEHADAMILSAAPEMIESRRQAEKARAEGRTTPAADIRRRLNDIDTELAAQVGDVESVKAGPVRRHTPRAAGLAQTAAAVPDYPDQIDHLTDLTNLLGKRQGARVNHVANVCASQITRESLAKAAEAGLIDQDELQEQLAERLGLLNASLLTWRLRHELFRDLQERVDAVRAGTGSLEDILEISSNAALDEASTFVSAVNADVITSSTQGKKLSPESMEEKLSVILGALEKA